MWKREIAAKFWASRKVYEPRRERAMRCYVMDRKSARYFEKENGSRVWNPPVSAADLSAELGNMAIVVALDERNFNESLNAYVNGELYAQLAYDEHLGWIS